MSLSCYEIKWHRCNQELANWEPFPSRNLQSLSLIQLRAPHNEREKYISVKGGLVKNGTDKILHQTHISLTFQANIQYHYEYEIWEQS